MSPPTQRGGPPSKRAARTALPSTARFIIPEGEHHRQYPDRESMIPGGSEVEPRAGGLIRVTTERVVDAYCSACGRRPKTTGSAAHHAQKSGHAVLVDYRARFSFHPAPDPDAGWIG